MQMLNKSLMEVTFDIMIFTTHFKTENYKTKPFNTLVNSMALPKQRNTLPCFNAHIQKHKRERESSRVGYFYLYKYLINSHMTTTKTTIPITDKSMHKQEQPPLVRLFKTAKFFCTLCFHKRNSKGQLQATSFLQYLKSRVKTSGKVNNLLLSKRNAPEIRTLTYVNVINLFSYTFAFYAKCQIYKFEISKLKCFYHR